jgi:DNA modification methylase
MNNLFTLHLGDCLESLRTMADNSIDAVISDPPYGLSQHTPEQVLECLKAWLAGEVYVPKGKGFMGKSWDAWVPGPEVWRECLRVLKPGGHVLAFAGTRSMDLMSMAIRLAGFELRDAVGYAHDGGGAPLLSWCYGSGFPKSLDVSKALDRVNGEAGRLHKFTGFMRTTGLTARQINEATGTLMGSHYLTDKSQPAIPTCELWAKLRPLCGDVPVWVDELVERIEAEREVLGRSDNGIAGGTGKHAGQDAAYGFGAEYDITAPATESARQWQGWGTALKPAWEPIILARKPLIGTVAENVLAHGTGGLNIDGCRVGRDSDDRSRWSQTGSNASDNRAMSGGNYAREAKPDAAGRWPANLILSDDPEVVGAFPQAKGQQGSVTGEEPSSKTNAVYGQFNGRPATTPRGDAGSAARFFYCAKSSKRDRDEGLEGFEAKATAFGNQAQAELKRGNLDHDDGKSGMNKVKMRQNSHPTVKPTDLMAYLCRLVTPPGGVVLDPFMGSGSTGKAAIREGFQFIGCEMSPEYMDIARARIQHEVDKIEAARVVPEPVVTPQPDLFA